MKRQFIFLFITVSYALNGWTPELRARHPALIRQRKPWERSPGPRIVWLIFSYKLSASHDGVIDRFYNPSDVRAIGRCVRFYLSAGSE